MIKKFSHFNPFFYRSILLRKINYFQQIRVCYFTLSVTLEKKIEKEENRSSPILYVYVAVPIKI
jgi:hypothetical protein